MFVGETDPAFARVRDQASPSCGSMQQIDVGSEQSNCSIDASDMDINVGCASQCG